jgi:hypothetical protein
MAAATIRRSTLWHPTGTMNVPAARGMHAAA